MRGIIRGAVAPEGEKTMTEVFVTINDDDILIITGVKDEAHAREVAARHGKVKAVYLDVAALLGEYFDSVVKVKA
jgi:hypothetical protein